MKSRMIQTAFTAAIFIVGRSLAVDIEFGTSLRSSGFPNLPDGSVVSVPVSGSLYEIEKSTFDLFSSAANGDSCLLNVLVWQWISGFTATPNYTGDGYEAISWRWNETIDESEIAKDFSHNRYAAILYECEVDGTKWILANLVEAKFHWDGSNAYYDESTTSVTRLGRQFLGHKVLGQNNGFPTSWMKSEDALRHVPPTTISISNVVARQRYPWNGLVDIDFTLDSSDLSTNVLLDVFACDNMAGKALPARTVRLENGMFGDPLVVQPINLKDGSCRLVWDAGADLGSFVSRDIQVQIQASPTVGVPKYLILDLSSGNGDSATYPVSWLDAEPQGGWGDEYKTTKLVLRRIPAGTYTMGCLESENGFFGTEALPHRVMISKAFYIGVFEVTQKQWSLVMGDNPSYFTNSSCWEKRPVEEVSYAMIRGSMQQGVNWPGTGADVAEESFLGKLRARSPDYLWDIPTEAQWEYACRAGTDSALNSGKQLGNDGQDESMAEVGRYWFNGGSDYFVGCSSDAGTAEVGSFLPNSWGLYDMHGNVCEWTLDWYRPRNLFSEECVEDPYGPSRGNERVLRGGSWNDRARKCRSSFREVFQSSYEHYNYDPPYRNPYNGFRLSADVVR